MAEHYRIEQMIQFIDEPNRTACSKILFDNYDLFRSAPGSSHNHQAWPGGYYDHIEETMNIVGVLYRQLNSLRPLPFSLGDALLVIFLHDLEKPWKYVENCELKTKESRHEFRMKKILEYGIVLTPDQQNGLKYVEGEFSDYSKDKRVMGPLAALCHMADVASARNWFEHPSKQNEVWFCQ